MTHHMSLCGTFYLFCEWFSIFEVSTPPKNKKGNFFTTCKKFARLSTLGDLTRTHRTQKYQPTFYSSRLRVYPKIGSWLPGYMPLRCIQAKHCFIRHHIYRWNRNLAFVGLRTNAMQVLPYYYLAHQLFWPGLETWLNWSIVGCQGNGIFSLHPLYSKLPLIKRRSIYYY